MKKAKFRTLEDQRRFFALVKKKLNLGATKIAKLLNLKSRGAIESYTAGRTAPPVEIVQILEKLTEIKFPYETVDGKIVRKKRDFLPYDPQEGKKNLERRFSKNFQEIDKLIKSKKSIKNITKEIRKKGYSFDTSLVSKWIGAYRTSLKIRIVEELIPKNDEIFLKGSIRKERGTFSICFNLSNLSKFASKQKFNVGLEFSKKLDSVRIFPLSFGRKLNVFKGNIRILVTEKTGIKEKNSIRVYLKPKDFEFTFEDSVYDKDARTLVKPLLSNGFKIDTQRSTPSNHKGDLSVYLNNTNYIIEITRAKSYKSCYFKLGQCYVQNIFWPEAKQILVCDNNFLLDSARQALKKLNVKVMEVNFKEQWQKKVIQEMKNLN